MKVNWKKIIDFRHKLHKFPELSKEEKQTAEYIKNFVSHFKPDRIYENIVGNSLAVVFEGKQTGPNVVFRADIDALPIDETDFHIPYRSVYPGIAHKCGHDGHTAILTALAEAISNNRPKKGKTILLFQAEEETLTGAFKLMDSQLFKNFDPNIILGFHNLPGYPLGSIVIKDKNFTVATNGMNIKLYGKSAHAAYPDQGISPIGAVEKILKFLRYDIYKNNFLDKVLATVTYLNVGKPNYGLIPSEANIIAVLRAFQYKDLDNVIGLVSDFIKNVAKQEKLSYKINYSDDAPPIYNDLSYTEQVIRIAELLGLNLIKIDKPFLWAEDFGYYTIKYKGVYIGFGTGTEIQLHQREYDFNDNLIMPAVEFLFALYNYFQNN